MAMATTEFLLFSRRNSPIFTPIGVISQLYVIYPVQPETFLGSTHCSLSEWQLRVHSGILLKYQTWGLLDASAVLHQHATTLPIKLWGSQR
jgi:hypothetical protein